MKSEIADKIRLSRDMHTDLISSRAEQTIALKTTITRPYILHEKGTSEQVFECSDFFCSPLRNSSLFEKWINPFSIFANVDLFHFHRKLKFSCFYNQ